MEKQEYLNIIINEIKKNEELLKDTNKSISFYEKMNDEEKVNELEKNKKLYETRIKYLKGIEKLPLYLKINNMTFDELNKYKNNLIENKENAINELNIKLKEVEKHIIDNDSDINSLYDLYKKTNNNNYVEEAKYTLNCIKTYKDEIELIKEQIRILNHIKENILKSNRIGIIKQLFDENNVLDIENELSLYTPDKIDRLVVPMCNDLNVLDALVSEMEKYNELDKEKVYETIDLPRILDEYTFDDSYVSSLNWFADLIKAHLNPNYDTKLEMPDIDDFDYLETNIEYGIAKINKDEVELENYNYILELFPTDVTNFKVDALEQLVEKLLKNNEEENYLVKDIKILVDELKELDVENFSLMNKYQTRSVINKKEIIKLKRNEKLKKVLDFMWFYLIEKIEEVLSRINHNYEFYTKLENKDIDEDDNKIIIQKGEYNNLNLYNTKVLILKTLEKYNNLNRELYELKEINEENKISFIKRQANKDNQMESIIDNIDDLYKKVNDKGIIPSDYNKIINVFKNNTIIDSIAKVEREELINKVKVNSNNYDLLEILELNNNFIGETNKNEKEKIINEEEIKEDKVNEEEKHEDKTNKKCYMENNNIEKESKKDKINKETLNKIKDTINKLGLSNEQIREIIDKIIKDDLLIDNILKLDKKGTLNKDQIKKVIKDIKIDENTDFIILISELYEKLDLDEDTIKELGNEILKDRSLIIDVLKENKKILFNLVKNGVMKKILKK